MSGAMKAVIAILVAAVIGLGVALAVVAADDGDEGTTTATQPTTTAQEPTTGETTATEPTTTTQATTTASTTTAEPTTATEPTTTTTDLGTTTEGSGGTAAP
jgi:hypothetical protein